MNKPIDLPVCLSLSKLATGWGSAELVAAPE